LKEEALYRTLWRTRFGRSCGLVVRQTTEWMNRIYKYGRWLHNATWRADSWTPMF
jgi:hypothetical protein